MTKAKRAGAVAKEVERLPSKSKAPLGLDVVAHTCNPSYSGGRDQENPGSKPAQANSSRDPILKIPNIKKALIEWLKV
jgi:hypothetical protein